MKKRVVAAVDDLFFAAKIRGAAEQAGAEIVFAKTVEKLREEAARETPDLIIIDLQTTKLDPFEAIRGLKSDERTRAAPVVAFFSHVETELQRRAKEAGVEHVLPRSVFSQRLAEMLREVSPT
jgi:CheY-like chemotaxis protein